MRKRKRDDPFCPAQSRPLTHDQIVASRKNGIGDMIARQLANHRRYVAEQGKTWLEER